MRTRRLLFLAALIGGLAACGDDPAAPAAESFSLEVVNHHPHTMIVSYDDGAMHELGPVGAGHRHTFEIVNPAKFTVMVMARNAANTHKVHETVTLQRGRTVTFEIKMSMGGHGG